MLNDSPRIHKMVEKLYNLMAEDEISNEWECNFIENMHNLMGASITFTQNQVAKIEDLFGKY